MCWPKIAFVIIEYCMIDSYEHKYPEPITPAELEKLGLIDDLTQTGRPRKPKKFRFELLSDWILANFPPCQTADVGGGKGLLSYLLNENGFTATVIDPVHQELPEKYKNLTDGKRIKISPDKKVPRLSQPFNIKMGENFDLLVGVHAHGCNMMIIDAAAKYHRNFVLLPCCVIDEPQTPPPGQHWFKWLVKYAQKRGLEVGFFMLNFKGQNVGIYCRQ